MTTCSRNLFTKHLPRTWLQFRRRILHIQLFLCLSLLVGAPLHRLPSRTLQREVRFAPGLECVTVETAPKVESYIKNTILQFCSLKLS